MKKFLTSTDATLRACAPMFRGATVPVLGRGVPTAGWLPRERGSAPIDLTWTTVV